MRFTKRMVTQGHVTIPTDLRNAMEISPGDLVEFQILGIIRKKSTQAPARESRMSTPTVDA